MPLSENQITSLINKVKSTQLDPLDCDECFEHMAEFVEAELSAREIPEALKAIQTHLDQCKCCHDEFEALIDGLRALEGQA